jgi:hypothetical protein
MVSHGQGGEIVRRQKFSIGLLVLICGELFCQPSPKGADSSTCVFAEIYDAAGWRIPGVAGSQEATVERTEPELPGVPRSEKPIARVALPAMSGVFVTEMKPGQSDLELALPYCSLSDLGRLVVGETKPITVHHLWKFDLSGKVFAYGLEYVVRTNPPSLAFGQVLFYDPDGTGTFTVAKRPKPFLFRSLEVPAWAKQ